jgi:N-hydroxyarylamine O-acetyltransferase
MDVPCRGSASGRLVGKTSMLDQYFRRLGYTGAGIPSLSTLRDIHALHVSALPFENITPFLGEEVSLNLDALVAKMIHRRRGGYCFEQKWSLQSRARSNGLLCPGI